MTAPVGLGQSAEGSPDPASELIGGEAGGVVDGGVEGGVSGGVEGGGDAGAWFTGEPAPVPSLPPGSEAPPPPQPTKDAIASASIPACAMRGILAIPRVVMRPTSFVRAPRSSGPALHMEISRSVFSGMEEILLDDW